MNDNTNISTNTQTDTLAKDFMTAVVIVSLTANLAVFTTWLTVALS